MNQPAAGMNRAAGQERRGRGNGVHFATTWQAFVAAAVVAVAWALRTMLKFVIDVKDATEAVRWVRSIFKRPEGESPFGGCYVLIDPSKWAFIVALVLLGVLLGLYIAYIFSRAIEQAHETQRRFANVFRRVMAAVSVYLFPAIEAAEVEG